MVARFWEPDLAQVIHFKEKKDVTGLIRALKAVNPQISEPAADALVSLGSDVTETLLQELRKKNKHLRLGIIGVLSKLGDKRAVIPLIGMLSDPGSEVRWQAAIALGELGDLHAVDPLVVALGDPDKYVRYGAAASLAKIGWQPAVVAEEAVYYAAIPDWTGVMKTGRHAVPALANLLKDRDPRIRLKAVRTLGELGIADAAPAITQTLSDEDAEVRWEAMLASQKCGIPLLQVPRALSLRPKMRKNPLIAGFLNFMLPGLGYGYLGRWWGIMVFQIEITVTVWLYKVGGEANAHRVLFPIYLLLAFHAWYIAEKMPEDPP